MTVLNPNTNFPKKKKYEQEQKINKYGGVSASNIKWAYNFDPLKKWAAIILSAILFAGIVFHFIEKNAIKAQEQALKIEAEDAKRKYLEKYLEKVKQQTIAEEMIKASARKGQ